MNFKIEYLNKEILKSQHFTLPFSSIRACGVWRDNNNEIIAIIQGKGLECVNSFNIHIDLFEVKIKNSGYGQKCIYNLFDLYKNLQEVTGESEESAVFFWKNLGGFFIDYCAECDNLSSCIEHGYCCEETESKDFTLTRDSLV